MSRGSFIFVLVPCTCEEFDVEVVVEVELVEALNPVNDLKDK